MNTEHFKLYLEHIRQVKNFPASEIEALIEAYPFCSNLYFLLAKKYKDEKDDINFERSIQRLAPLAPDRNYLMRIFENDEFFNQYEVGKEYLSLQNIHESLNMNLGVLSPSVIEGKKSEELYANIPSDASSLNKKTERLSEKIETLPIIIAAPAIIAQNIVEEKIETPTILPIEIEEEEAYDSIDDILDDATEAGEPISENEDNIPQPDDEPITTSNIIEIQPIPLEQIIIEKEDILQNDFVETEEEEISLQDEEEEEEIKVVQQPIQAVATAPIFEIYNSFDKNDDEDEEEEDEDTIESNNVEKNNVSDAPMPLPKESFSSWLKQLQSPEKSMEKIGGRFQIPPIAQDEDFKQKLQEKLKEKEQKKKKEQELLDFAEESLKTNEDVVSETLAHLLATQGHTEKAIKMYQKLKLTFPEKSAYFAALILKLKNL